MCLMEQIIEALTKMVEGVIAFLPALIGAVIVVLIGYGVGSVVGKAVNKLIEKMGLEKSFDETSTGRAFRAAELDMSSFVGGVIKAFIVILSIIFAIQILDVGGPLGGYLIDVANYLPRLLGGLRQAGVDRRKHAVIVRPGCGRRGETESPIPRRKQWGGPYQPAR